MSEPKRKPITDEELSKMIEQLPAQGAAIGLVLLRLVQELQEIKENVLHVARAIDDMARSNVSGGDIERLGRVVTGRI